MTDSKTDVKTRFTETFSLTFGDRAENHAGMQLLGVAAKQGFTVDELKFLASDTKGSTLKNAKFHDLTEWLPKDTKNDKNTKENMDTNGKDNMSAGLLIIRNGVDQLLGMGAKDS